MSDPRTLRPLPPATMTMPGLHDGEVPYFTAGQMVQYALDHMARRRVGLFGATEPSASDSPTEHSTK